jgi:acetoin utilization protein AcuB
MGLPVQVSPQTLLDKKRVKPLSALAGAADDFSHEIKAENKLKTRPTPLDSYDQGQNQNDAPKAKQVFLAQDIMATKVETLQYDMTFAQAREKFQQLRYRHFPVIGENKTIVGILSDRDMLSSANLDYLAQITIDKLMKQPVLSASPDTQIREVCQVMFNHHIGALPITDHQGNLFGMITRSDILRSMIKHAPMELWI